MTIAILTGPKAYGSNPVASPHSAGEVYVSDGYYDLAAALVVDNIVKLCRIPANCVPIDCMLDMDDLDSVAGLVGDLALMEEGGADVIADSQMILGSTLGQAAGVARMDHLTAAKRAVIKKAVDKPRLVVYKVTTAPATGEITGRIYAAVFVRAAEYGEKG